MKLIKVIWIDAEDFEQTWTASDELETFKKTDCEVESVGFLVSKTKKFVILAADSIKGSTLGRITKIPAKMIKEIKPLNG